MKTEKEDLSSEETSTNPQTVKDAVIAYFTKELKEIKGRISNLEAKYIPEKAFFKSGTRVNNLALIVFLVLPLIQLGLIAVLFILFKHDTSFTNFAMWIFGLLGLGALVELGYVIYKIRVIEDKLRNE